MVLESFPAAERTKHLIKQLSELFYISEKTLCRRFFKYCDKTIYTFQNDLKPERVHQFLLEYLHLDYSAEMGSVRSIAPY